MKEKRKPFHRFPRKYYNSFFDYLIGRPSPSRMVRYHLNQSDYALFVEGFLVGFIDGINKRLGQDRETRKENIRSCILFVTFLPLWVGAVYKAYILFA